jgi:hypothetical protein
MHSPLKCCSFFITIILSCIQKIFFSRIYSRYSANFFVTKLFVFGIIFFAFRAIYASLYALSKFIFMRTLLLFVIHD